MKKYFLTLICLFSVQFAFAQDRAELCRHWYSYDIFKGYLNLAVNPPQLGEDKPVLWMDMHIPWGIRPFPYEVQNIQCGNNSLYIKATSFSEMPDVELKFVGTAQEADYQPATLHYVDKNGSDVSELPLECSKIEVAKFCVGK